MERRRDESGVGLSIEVRNLTKMYGGFRALKAIDFEVKPGEIVGFLGPNGAGKTTTMKILTCFMAATEGEAKVAGFDVYRQLDEVRKRVGYLPENVPLYDEMMVLDYLRFVAEIREVPSSRRSERLREVVEICGLREVVERDIRTLSKGYRQRVGLAQAIIHEPDVLILDEPTTGLDPNQIVEIRDVIKQIGREKTIIFSTHILQEVTAVCDRIIIINQGELVADGTLDELEAAVEKTNPGLIVGFGEDADVEALRGMLEGLPGAQAVRQPEARRGGVSFRVETDDEEALRRGLVEQEHAHAWGLRSLVRAEPTLEEIFRVYTEGSTEEARGRRAS